MEGADRSALILVSSRNEPGGHGSGGSGRFDRSLLARATRNPLEPFSIARAYATLAEADSAIVWLERSGWRWPHRANRADPALDGLRDDPRFTRILARVEREMGLR